MGHHEGHKVVAKPRPISQCKHGSNVGSVKSKIEQGADSKSSAECERIDRDHDVVGHDRAGAFLVRFVESFPPRRFCFNVEFAESRADADEL